MVHFPEIRRVPLRLEHLILGPDFAEGRGAGPARLVWFALWTHRRSTLEVYPGDPRLAQMTGLTPRQVQEGLRFLDGCNLIERGSRPTSGTRHKRVIRLQPRVKPSWRGEFEIPPLDPLREVCVKARDRPHADIAVMVGLYLMARECGAMRPKAAFSDPFRVTWACLADLLGLSRNTPRRALDRLRKLDLVRPTYRGEDWSSGLRVTGPLHWYSLAALGRYPSQLSPITRQVPRPRGGMLGDR